MGGTLVFDFLAFGLDERHHCLSSNSASSIPHFAVHRYPYRASWFPFFVNFEIFDCSGKRGEG